MDDTQNTLNDESNVDHEMVLDFIEECEKILEEENKRGDNNEQIN